MGSLKMEDALSISRPLTSLNYLSTKDQLRKEDDSVMPATLLRKEDVLQPGGRE